MRRVLIDHARARLADKRGGNRVQVPLTEGMPDVATLAESADPDQVLGLERALTRLESTSPDAARVIKLRFYAGLTVEQTAVATGMSVATVHRKWAYARLFLFRELSTPEGYVSGFPARFLALLVGRRAYVQLLPTITTGRWTAADIPDVLTAHTRPRYMIRLMANELVYCGRKASSM